MNDQNVSVAANPFIDDVDLTADSATESPASPWWEDNPPSDAQVAVLTLEVAYMVGDKYSTIDWPGRPTLVVNSPGDLAMKREVVYRIARTLFPSRRDMDLIMDRALEKFLRGECGDNDLWAIFRRIYDTTKLHGRNSKRGSRGEQLSDEQLFRICAQAANRVWSAAIRPEDRRQEAYAAILRNYDTIQSAHNPYGMALIIAIRHLMNLTIRLMYHEIPLSLMRVGAQGQRALSNTEKFDTLTTRMGMPTDAYYWRELNSCVEEAFRQLQSPSENVAVKLSFGFFDCGEQTYEEIGEVLRITPRQARYRVQQGLLHLRRFLDN